MEHIFPHFALLPPLHRRYVIQCCAHHTTWPNDHSSPGSRGNAARAPVIPMRGVRLCGPGPRGSGAAHAHTHRRASVCVPGVCPPVQPQVEPGNAHAPAHRRAAIPMRRLRPLLRLQSGPGQAHARGAPH